MCSQNHSTCVVCGAANGYGLHLDFKSVVDGSVQASFACDEIFQGYSGVLHGGVVTSLLDGAMTNCLFAHGIPAMTAELTVRFRHPVVTGSRATAHAWIDRSCRVLHLLSAEIIQDGVVKATATGKFIECSDVATGERQPRDPIARVEGWQDESRRQAIG
jgi:uncharacterized protein (TIGR00369 family)